MTRRMQQSGNYNRVLAADLSPDMLTQSRTKYVYIYVSTHISPYLHSYDFSIIDVLKGISPLPEFVRCDAAKLPFKTNSLDVFMRELPCTAGHVCQLFWRKYTASSNQVVVLCILSSPRISRELLQPANGPTQLDPTLGFTSSKMKQSWKACWWMQDSSTELMHPRALWMSEEERCAIIKCVKKTAYFTLNLK